MGNQGTLNLPGIAATELLLMSKALRTGGTAELSIFVRMFEEALEILERDWDLLSLGSTFKTTGVRLASLLWVDNCFILAESLQQYEFMLAGLSNLMWTRFKWKWKPSSLELILERLFMQMIISKS